MRKLFFGLLCIVTFITFLPFNSLCFDEVVEEMKLYVGQPQTILINSPKRIAVGNPQVADIVNITKKELTIDPKAAGSTTLIVWDNFGEQSYRLNIFTEDMSIIKRRVDNILSKINVPEVYAKAEDEEAKVLLLGSVKTAKDKARIMLVLDQLKNKIIDLITVREEEAVIEIDVQIIELNKGSQNTLGFTWPGSISLTEVGSPGISAAGAKWGSLFKVAKETRDAFTLKLDALIQEGNARILSRPRLSCQSGKEAKLVVGGEVPVLSGTATPSTTGTGTAATSNGSVEYKEYGIILNVKPLLEDSGRIHLGLDITVSEVGDQVETDYALAYKMTKRTATTELFLDNGQTMAIGGLIKQKKSEDIKRVPWLSDIPVLGNIFKQRSKKAGWDSDVSEITDVELFITLTPRVVSEVKPQEEVRSQVIKLPPVNDDRIKDPFVKYSKLVQKRVLSIITYPIKAKEAGFQGTVMLNLKLSPQGELLESIVKESSGYRILDDAAIQRAQETAPYPPFPPDIKEEEIWVDIPITYQLE